MHRTDAGIELSATDLSQYLGCKHRTGLDLAVAGGTMSAPSWADPVLEILRQRGIEHERMFVRDIKAQNLRVTDCTELAGQACVDATLVAMRDGVDVILQGALRGGSWFGRPDVLRRTPMASALGGWSYYPIDTKLAKETTGGTILQLSLYAEMLASAQELLPSSFVVVTPHPQRPHQEFRVLDFAAYFRLVQRRLLKASAQQADVVMVQNYPEPVAACEVCRWRARCDQRRHADDHLSLVAGTSRLQRRELESHDVRTLTGLGTLSLPLPFSPPRGSKEGYVRVREQARVQLAGRAQGKVVYEVLPPSDEHGLARLPAPSPGDLFIDFEGDSFAQEGGREYLFGAFAIDASGALSSLSRWALKPGEEKIAFQALIDAIVDRRAAHPTMHAYHYAPYEPAAIKRLMGRYGTREAEVDTLLRAGVFVDLYAVVRSGIRASVESYSIKALEPLYGFSRTRPLAEARVALRVVERALELNTLDLVTPETRAAVEEYNRDDCLSTRELRDWLEAVRADAVAQGAPMPRPVPVDGAAPATIDARAQRIAEMVGVLTQDVPDDPDLRSDDQRARLLLANLLDYHRRESKAPWWEYFRLRDMPEEELFDERMALAGLTFDSVQGGTAKAPIHRYRYPQQDNDLREGDKLHLQDDTPFGEVVGVDRGGRTLDVKKPNRQIDTHPRAVFAHNYLSSDVLAAAIETIANDVIAHGLTGGTQFRVARELLLARSPRLRTGAFEPKAGEDSVRFAVRIAPSLQETVLAIQGPPGTGKTFTGAEMITELVRHGLKVGVTAVSHKVIRNLLDRTADAACRLGQPVRCAHKVPVTSAGAGAILEVQDNDDALAALTNGQAHVLGGTAWLWALPSFIGAVDVLFVDEAGQMSLANVLACSPAAKSIVLLGDPQQLEQPQQGVHPDGADSSSLQHLLMGKQTIPAGRGIFLPETWRMHPVITAFTSELFYEGRLNPRAGLERQMLRGTDGFDGAGLWNVPVDHDGNQNSSAEEVDAVKGIIDRLLRAGSTWTDSEGVVRPLGPTDILVVAPYNAHVALLEERFATRGLRVGTVDRFQGQEAPVVIYSTATSRPEDAPRGMEFLYSLNRLNVATSRARCSCVLVANPRLLEPDCHRPQQMRLANALCRFAELSTIVAP